MQLFLTAFSAVKRYIIFSIGRWAIGKGTIAAIFLLPLLGSAKNIDSLEHITPTLPASQEKAKNLIDIGDHYLRSDFEKSIKALKEAITLSEQVQYIDGLAMAYNSLTVLHTEYGAYTVAMEYGEKLLAYSEQSGSEFRMANAYINVGNIFLYLEDLPKAKQYYEQAQPYYLKQENYSGLGIVKLNLGGIFMSTDDYDSARVYFEAAQSYFLQMKKRNPYLEAGAALNLGTVAQRIEDWETALRFYSVGDSLSRVAGDSIQLARNFLNFARIYAEQGYFAKADSAFRRALATHSPTPKIVSEQWMTSSLIAERKGDFEKALADYKKHAALEDSIVGLEALETVSRLQIVFDTERKNSEISLLQNGAKNNRLLLLVLGTGLLLVLIFVGILIRSGRKQRKLNLQLEQANQSLQAQAEKIKAQMEVQETLNRERNGLIQIVAHDLKAPINNTLSLITFLEDGPLDTATQSTILQKIRKVNVGAQNLIRDLMDLNPNETSLGNEPDQAIDWVGLVRDQVEGFRELAHQKQIELQFAPESPSLSLTTKPAAWSRIVDNLVSNALKFSFPETTVTVRTFVQGGQAILEIADQGQGIRQADFAKVYRKFSRLEARPTAGESSTGLGLSIVKALVEVVGGEISFRSEWGKGTTFSISFPLEG